MRRFFITVAMLSAISTPNVAADWSAVASALGKSGTEGAGGAYRVRLPRTHLNVTLDGITLKPTLALGSWVAGGEERSRRYGSRLESKSPI